jgi:trehalose-6-phosphate hydrolase
LLILRNNEKALQYGSYEKLERHGDMILFTRVYQGDKITVQINFGKETTVNLPKGAKILMGYAALKQNEFLIYKTTASN